MSAGPSSRLPADVQTHQDLAALQGAAERRTTACGNGHLVWHHWAPPPDRSAKAPPVLLLHGGSGSWNHWVRNIAPLVDAGREVWVLDLPGFGDSDPPPDGHDADVMPAWVEAGLQALIGPGPVDLVGFSFGGMVGGLVAAQWPQRVQRLVLVGSPSITTSALAELDLRMWSHLPDEAAREGVLRHNLLQLMLRHPASVTPLVLEMHRDNLRRESRVMKRRRLSRTPLLRATLPNVQAPVWGIWGADDALFVPCRDEIASGLALAPRFQGLQFIEGCGHWAPFEGAPDFNRLLSELLQPPC